MDTFSLYAVYAALDAMEMSGITEENTNFDRLGCIMASGIGGLEQSQKNSQAIVAKGPRKGVAPLYVPLAIANMATGNVALRTGARGVSRAEVTACAAGANSIGSAFREIKHGYADAMIADNIAEAAELAGAKAAGHIEGDAKTGWVLIDLGDIVVSVFGHDERGHFNLEKLWSDAPMVDISGFIAE